jgi:hypothetical protein
MKTFSGVRVAHISYNAPKGEERGGLLVCVNSVRDSARTSRHIIANQTVVRSVICCLLPSASVSEVNGSTTFQ